MENGFLLFYYGATILSFSLLGISLFFGCFNYLLLDKEQKWYLYYLGFIFIIELITKLLLIFKKENMLVYPFYISGEFLILSIIFIIGLSFPRKLFIVVIIISGFLFSEAIFLWISNKNITSGVGKIFSHLIIVCMFGYYLIRELKVFERKKQNKFLIIYGCLFLYYSVSLFIFLLLDQLTTIAVNNASVIWGMNNVLSSVLYGGSLYTFLRLRRLM